MSSSYVYSTKPNQNFGGTIYSGGAGLIAVDSTVRDQFIAAGFGQDVDLPVTGDLSTIGYAKTAAIMLTFTGSTALTLDLTALAAATGVAVAGATSFTNWFYIFIQNISAGTKPFTMAPGASNPLRTQLGGTSPTFNLACGDVHHWNTSAGAAVDSTHRILTFTPTSAGSGTVWIGGN
jgi:hypothetical protein